MGVVRKQVLSWCKMEEDPDRTKTNSALMESAGCDRTKIRYHTSGNLGIVWSFLLSRPYLGVTSWPFVRTEMHWSGPLLFCRSRWHTGVVATPFIRIELYIVHRAGTGNQPAYTLLRLKIGRTHFTDLSNGLQKMMLSLPNRREEINDNHNVNSNVICASQQIDDTL